MKQQQECVYCDTGRYKIIFHKGNRKGSRVRNVFVKFVLLIARLLIGLPILLYTYKLYSVFIGIGV